MRFRSILSLSPLSPSAGCKVRVKIMRWRKAGRDHLAELAGQGCWLEQWVGGNRIN